MPRTLEERVEHLESLTPALESRILSLEARVKSLEEVDPEDEALMEEMKKAFRAWLSLGIAGRWIVYLLASVAAGVAAYNTLIKGVRDWLTG